MRIDLPKGWSRCTREIRRKKPKKVLVLGSTDSGKSTFIFYLIGSLLEEGFNCSLIDADIGQKDIGPPATVTLAEFSSLRELERNGVGGMYFVGSTSPRGHFMPLLVGTKLLAEAAEGEMAVVNTTGYIAYAGFALKSFKIELLVPEIVVAFQRRRELEALLKAHPHLSPSRLAVSPKARPKSFEERRLRRRDSFRRYFSSAKLRKLKMERLSFQRGSPKKLRSNLLVGLADSQATKGLGIVKGFAGGVLEVFTPVEEEVSIVQLGSLLLKESGEEIGKIRL